MTNSYKDIIEELRKKNGMSMQEICGDYIDHSSYSRFVHKGQSLSADKLIYIISQLDLNFRKAGLFDHVIHISNADRVAMAKVIHLGDVDLMKQTVDLFASKSKHDYDIYGMMAVQIRLQMGGEIAAQQFQSLKKYIFKVHTWDYKEMYLFTFIMNRIESPIILSLINRIFKRAADPLYLERNLNLTILLDEAHVEFLKRNELDHAQEIFNKLTSLVINKSFLSVQGFYSINQALHHLLIEGGAKDFDKIVRLYQNFTAIGADYLALRLKTRYLDLQPTYLFPDIEWTTS